MPPEADRASIPRLYLDGASIRAIAGACGRDPKTVHRRLAAAGVPRRRPGGSARTGPRAKITPEQVPAIAAAYQAGKVSLADLGVTYKVSGDTIARKLRQAGVTIRPRGRNLTAADLTATEEVLHLHAQGLPPRDIAARLHRGTAADVARVLHRAGVIPHRARPIPRPRELAVSYARAGSLRALSASLKIAEDRLRAALQAAGVPPGSLRHVPVPLRTEVARLAAAGVSPDQIAARTGLSPELFPQVGRPHGATAGSPHAA